MSEKTLRRRAHAAGMVLAKARTKIDGTPFWILIRGKRLIAVTSNEARVARLISEAA